MLFTRGVGRSISLERTRRRERNEFASFISTVSRSRMNALRRHPRSLHLALLALRLLVALTAQSIIHPDEHFQNSEIAATVFDYANTGAGPLRTWEWIGEAPCRSIVPVWATTGAGFAVLKFVAGDR